MVQEQREEQVQQQSSTRSDQKSTENVLTEPDCITVLQNLARSGSDIFNNLFELFMVETRLAGRSLAAMLMLAMILAVIVLSTWLLLNGVVATWLVWSDFFSLAQALFFLIGANVLMAVVIWLTIIRLSRNLTFPEFSGTLRNLFPPKEEK